MTIFLKIFSSCLSCPSWIKNTWFSSCLSCPSWIKDTWFSSCPSCSSWIKDMLCCPRETSPRSFHSPCSVPQVARFREVSLRFALPSPRRPGVIHGVTPPGSVLIRCTCRVTTPDHCSVPSVTLSEKLTTMASLSSVTLYEKLSTTLFCLKKASYASRARGPKNLNNL